MESRRMPPGFLWGAATASHQIEGAWDVDGKGESVWDRFGHTPGRIERGENGDVACDHYHRWKSDVALMASLNLNAYRFSISWPRVLPTGLGRVNEAGMAFYSKLVDELLEHRIRPLVTLYHWDHPQALEDKGGWTNRDSAAWFADYTATVVERLGDRVKDWLTLNEPASFIYGGHIHGTQAPGRKDRRTGFGAAHHCLMAHGMATRAIHACGGKGARAGIALNLLSLEPASGSAADKAACARLDAKKNRLFLDPVCGRGYAPDLLEVMPQLKEFIRPGDESVIAGPLDLLGVNYYHHLQVKDSPGKGPAPVGANAPLYGLAPSGEDADMLTSPTGLRTVLNRVHRDYGVRETIITENGFNRGTDAVRDGRVEDGPRKDYIRGHLLAIADAIEDGCNVKGYCVWSFMDNFEWTLGYRPRFGIVHVDYTTQRRTVKDSGNWMAKCAAANRAIM